MVNTGVLYLMKGVLGIPLIPASMIAIELAIVHNFIWHRNWTWKKRIADKPEPFFKQLLVYNTATGLVDILVNVSLLWILTTFFGVYYLIANVIGMIMGPVIKFWLNEKVIFRKQRKTVAKHMERIPASMTKTRETENRQRVNASLLSGFERVALPWMAKRLPQWITPDRLTAFGLISGLLIGAGYLLTHYHLAWLWLANLGLILHWWADSLDGTLARVRHIERPKYGFFVDHYSDAVTVSVITIAMGFSPIMDLTVALFITIGYHSLSILVYLVTIAREDFKISFGKLGPTEVRVIIFAANSLVFFLGNPVLTLAGYNMTLYTLCGVLVATGFAVFFLVSGAVERRRMLALERTNWQSKAQATTQPAVARTRANGHVRSRGNRKHKKIEKHELAELHT